eukprot:CAMPEP_0195282762 /NCGR_PEP_ID=MMETSP0707-20130614/1520_1 /TAXON_ID=33640 /ORGANISM="Asterionellopsis glacialis, Strain CCMP134" /LENGTH=519 /DNA_ID=CAMNT_0040341793 /DNA_START=36 /DNA_END=1595 /DNA_ORIENTATION=-
MTKPRNTSTSYSRRRYNIGRMTRSILFLASCALLVSFIAAASATTKNNPEEQLKEISHDGFSEDGTDSENLGWPWHKKNKTSPHESNKTSNACAVHKNCDTCANSSSLCHWCSDQTCHAKGSVHGCAYGQSCKKKDEKVDKTCGGHKTCSECALSSSMCHWCAQDQACHEIGSIYGCMNGVDCYSTDRCRRPNPEPIEDLGFQAIGFLPTVIIVALASICLCCATTGFCVAGGVKGAYDDLAHISSAQPATSSGNLPCPSPPSETELVPTSNQETEEVVLEDEVEEDQAEQEETDALLEVEENTTPYNLMQEEEVVHRAPATSRVVSKHMRCLYNSCTACYVATVAVICLSAIGSIRYFPKAPVYNVCSDAVAWKSLVDSMAKFSVNAKFELLVSVENPNHLDVALDMGKGSFKHNDNFVGTFEIPPVVVHAMSISDLMIIATFEPDKWDAFSLSKEYYQGHLVLNVDAEAMIRVPALANYSFPANFADLEVDVNEESDRDLCNCPQWSDVKNKTFGIF